MKIYEDYFGMFREFNWSLHTSMSNVVQPVDIAQEAVLLDSKLSGCSKPMVRAMTYEEEWESLVREQIDLPGLRLRALTGELRASRFRSISWKLFLGALTPGDANSWYDEVTASRNHYSNLIARLRVAPEGTAEPECDNPLSQHEQSTWHQFFCDRDLRGLIRQDVVRTFPGVDFFRSENIQELMINILFAYARENPAMCYRQGMHEVLAPVVFVVHCDQQALLHSQENGKVSEDIAKVLDPAYFEADSYTLFRRIMNAIEGSYLIANMAPTSTGYFPSNMTTCVNSAENQVVAQLNWIKERLLAPNDPQLSQHLEKLDIPLQLFGIRWLRLLFGREFPLQDLLVLWDAIFSDSSSFDLVNYIVISMLVAIRSSLLKSDYTACLTQLMRYPGSMDISIIIDYALHLKSPDKYSLPSIVDLPKKIPIEVDKTDPNRLARKKQVTVKRNQKNSNEKVLYRIPVRTEYGAHDGIDIVEGYKLSDADVMAELMNAYTVMSLVRLKLNQYHTVLEEAVPVENIEAQQALTGIHELCSLLKVHRIEKLEKGTEVNESPPKVVQRKPSVDMTVFKEVITPVKESSPS